MGCHSIQFANSIIKLFVFRLHSPYSPSLCCRHLEFFFLVVCLVKLQNNYAKYLLSPFLLKKDIHMEDGDSICSGRFPHLESCAELLPPHAVAKQPSGLLSTLTSLSPLMPFFPCFFVFFLKKI